MVTEKRINLKILEKFTYAVVAVPENKKDVGVITATLNYIPLGDFKEVFKFVEEELVNNRKIKKLVFDERNLTVFDHSTMEWFFTKWQNKMYDEGLQAYRNILPENNVFINNVEEEQKNIRKDHPNLKLDKMDIKDSNSLLDAIDN